MEEIRMMTMGAMQGWQCPVCGKVLAPFMTMCPCNGNQQSVTTTTTGTVNVTLDYKEIEKAINEAQTKKQAKAFEEWAKAFNFRHGVGCYQ
jgi:uncharacterized OB-fold protein